MKKIVSGILIASLLIGSPLTVFAEVTESTSSSVLESAPDTTASDTAVSEISPQASTTKTTDSTIKDAVKQSESVSSTEEKTESSSTESSASSTDNSVKTEKKTASVQKALTKAATQELSTDFLDRTKRFSENGFTKDLMQDVTDIQSWLNTYDIFSLSNVSITNYSFSDSIAVLVGGNLTAKGAGTIKFKDSSNSVYGTLIKGSIYSENTTLDFSEVKNGIYSDFPLRNQVGYDSSRPTGNGEIKGLDSSKIKSFQEVLQGKGIKAGNIDENEENDFFKASLNQSSYLNSLTAKSIEISGDTKVNKEPNAQSNIFVYNLSLKSNSFPNIKFNGFGSNDVVVVNVLDKNGIVDIGGGVTLNGAPVIWNFPTAKNITITTGFTGNVIAPNATVTTHYNEGEGVASKSVVIGGANAGAGIISQQIVEVDTEADIKKILESEVNAKQYVETITNTSGVSYSRGDSGFSTELGKVNVSYYDGDLQPVEVSAVSSLKGNKYLIRYTYGNDKSIYSWTILSVKNIGSLTLSKIPNLNFGTIKLGSGTIQLGLKRFQVSDSPAASNGTDEGIIQITDTRADGKWNLTLSLEDNNFKLSNSNSDSIGGRLNLSLSEGGKLSTADPNSTEPSSTLSGSGTKIYNVDVDKNSTLEINKSPTKVGTYQGTLNWKLSDTVN